jgi:mitogen-activated protein kinase kinase
MKPGLKLSDATGPATGSGTSSPGDGSSDASGVSAFSKYSEYIDTKAGTLNFKNKAILHGGGVEFSSGHSFSISLDEVERLDELGKGNYGTVYKVRHSRPQMRKPGMGLRGIISRPTENSTPDSTSAAKSQDSLSGYIMAMKEIRLELDENKFAQIIMELDILHRCVSPFIIDFYGAFFQEGAVYMCVEYMDGGSIDKLYKDGVPENILRKVALSTVMGLKTLKDDHNIIHRDVKPTNILVNSRGQIKICDFGVSGNLVASIAKTNIGCQSYMAPERIAGGGVQQSGATGGGTYSVQSDIWSLGLTIIECAIGRYPYPPETFNNIFSQLHAFVRACLDKNPSKRPSYSTLLRHPWLAPLMQPPTESDGTEATSAASSDGQPGGPDTSTVTEDEEVAEWVKERIERRQRGHLQEAEKPALHAVALDAVPGSPLLDDPSSLPSLS